MMMGLYLAGINFLFIMKEDIITFAICKHLLKVYVSQRGVLMGGKR